MDKNIVRLHRRAYGVVMKGLALICAAFTAALAAFLIIYVLSKGIPSITWELLSTKPSYLNDKIGILPDILNTLYIVLDTLLWVLPLGVGAAIYLTEHHLRPRRNVILLRASRPSDLAEGRRDDACHHEPADGHAHDAGEPQDRSAEPARGCVRARRGQVARYPHRRVPRLRGRHHNRLHPRRGRGEFGIAFAIAAILMALTVIINLATTLIGRHYRKRRSI